MARLAEIQANPTDNIETLQYYPRDVLLGGPTYWKISNFGAAQFRNEYDPGLLSTILKKAKELKESLAFKRHLNLKYIRGAQRYIPEINELIHDAARLERLSALAQVPLEPYPVSVISSIITFMGPESDDGAIGWHCDGVPVTELVPLLMDDVVGGEVELYRGSSELGMSLIEDGYSIPDSDVLRIPHRLGYSTLGQLIRICHRTAPISHGYRVTLNLSLRSREKPYIDDNSLVYLGADNPDENWHSEYFADVQAHQLPAYRKAMEVA